MRALLVEETAEETAAMPSLLKRGLIQEGYSIDIAEDAATALWHATEFAYDVIILNVTLPALDSFETCRRLRGAECWAPVLMLAASNEISDRVEGLDAGADDYLHKPFSFIELTARLRALIRRGAPARPTVLHVGDLALDPGTHRAWRACTEISLTTKEFSLLEYFMRHPGQMMSRTAILEHVWDFAFDGMSNVVDQYVAYLRRKIDRPFHRTDLQTIRGSGYRLQVCAAPRSPRNMRLPCRRIVRLRATAVVPG